MDMGNVRMVQRGERLRFPREAREPAGIAREGVGQYFDSDVTIEPGVTRPVHLAHSAFADLGDNLVNAETATWAEGQCVWIIPRRRRRGRDYSRVTPQCVAVSRQDWRI